MLQLIKQIIYFPMRLFCTVVPFLHSLFKGTIFVAHYYIDEQDQYIEHQTILVRPDGFRMWHEGIKMRPNETKIEDVTICLMTCYFCNHQEKMWMRAGRTLRDLPVLKIP